MKYILKYSILTLVALGIVGLQGCEEERWGNIPNLNEHVGAITLINVNPDKTFFNALNNLATEEVEFELNVDGFETTEVASVDIELIFTENDATVDAEGNPADVTYDPVFIRSVDASTLPATITFTATDALEAVQQIKPNYTLDSLEVGDGFNLIFPINTADGRRLTTALSSELCNEPVQPSFGGCNVAWQIACPSDLGGEYTVVSSGSSTDPCAAAEGVAVITDYEYPNPITITDLGGGRYSMAESLGGLYAQWYGECYGYPATTSNTFSDVCGAISGHFTTAFLTCCGDEFDVSGSIDPATGVITITWTNPFGDTGTNVYTPVP